MSDTATSETKKDTRAGNYFISNYPPFSFWSEDQATAVRSAFENPPVPGTPLGLYHHIPFCRKRCHFCYFRVYTDKNADEIVEYLDCTMRELEMLAKKPLLAGRKRWL
jgi:oxygen-independent coproporphyrinogen-3 oxidase